MRHVPSRRALFLSGVSAPWWVVPGATIVAAYQPKGVADLAASYINLANPGTNNAAPGVAPTLVPAGWGFNGTTQYLTTGIVPVRQVYTIIYRYDGTQVASTGVAFGALSSATAELGVYPRYTDGQSYFVSGGSSGTAAAYAAATNIAVAGTYAYRDGAQVGGAMAAGAGTITNALVIGAMNSGIINRFLPVTIVAFAIYSTTLSGADVAALTARMAAL